MGLFWYLLFFLLPVSFGFPHRNSEQQSPELLIPSDFFLLQTSKPVDDFQCKPNEHFSFCRAHCQHNCSNFGIPIPCPIGCFPGCVCDDGYIRGPENKCVLLEECNTNKKKEDPDELFKYTPFKCPDKESYSWCNAHCQSNCSTLQNPVPCSDECISGCVCNAGYARDRNGECIRTEQCIFLEEKLLKEEEEFCPPNEIYSPCLAHCQRNCTNWSDPSLPCIKICVPGCICDNGMVRGPYGNCIQPRKCLTSRSLQSAAGSILVDCPVDEHYDSCLAHCQKNCTNWDQDIECRSICVAGCVCDEGFVRAPHGKCVLVEKCSSLNQKTAINIKKKSLHSCPDGEIRNNFQSIQDSNVYCTSGNGVIELCPPTYLNGCVCKNGQIRRADNQECFNHRLLPNANEIHFIYAPSQSNSEIESTEESTVFSESTEKMFTQNSAISPVIPSVKINTQNNAKDEISTTILQETSTDLTKNTASSQSNLKLETTEESIVFNESTEKMLTSNSAIPSVFPNVEINKQNDETLTTISQETSTENVVNIITQILKCNWNECNAYCEKFGFPIGACIRTPSFHVYCQCFRYREFLVMEIETEK